MSMREMDKYTVTLEKKNYLLFKAIANQFQQTGWKEGDAENLALQTLLEGYDKYVSLLTKLKQLLEAYPMGQPMGQSRYR